MKRSVAVKGPTPRFVRWAIWCTCPFRDQVDHRFVDLAFRNLRGIRAFSQASLEGRLIEEICLHPETTHPEVEKIRGFSTAEVLDPFGGQEVVASACSTCPGNLIPIDGQPGMAGCYGFLTSNGLNLDRLLAGHQVEACPGFNLVELLDQAPKPQTRIVSAPDQHVWYWLWMSGELVDDQLKWAADLFDSVVQSATVPSVVSQFADAMRLAAERNLVVKGQCVPSGFSDGQVWALQACCPNCGYEPESSPPFNGCPVCSMQGELPPGQRSKVLGTRPYVDLDRVLGQQAALELAQRYRRRS